mmetsp:Transcript_11479/g.13177  ORF Transcript_11479/g.13177 Transcript_11479/m.13177 type:complete len:245 (-) Transcript_11479:147-881(-)|eukprot:CAMPEP_0184017580 /NCGR_PEP_ID=MMETSP0954-20121128/7624_1 /TAXON_ID=627963 /ORGANISM="Aplanochytrium sp, Strain PBS07" /LENGTH=244 /DNA_ID=CAMNT_0026298849 /DNA_START=371 /DNA_END=1105 /DNA_ORIENTATION=-
MSAELTDAAGTAASVAVDAVKVSNHPLLLHKVTQLRKKTTSNKNFRELLSEITSYLGYEATAEFQTKDYEIETPVAKHTGHKLTTKVALIPILRSGLGMVGSMLDVIPHAAVHHIGMYRNKEALLPIMYFNKLPKVCTVDVAMVLEPLIATSGTLSAVIDILKEWGVKEIKVISIVASKPGLKKLLTTHPDLSITVAAIDDSLTEDGVVIPGLGDTGDRQYEHCLQDHDAEGLENGQRKKARQA